MVDVAVAVGPDVLVQSHDPSPTGVYPDIQLAAHADVVKLDEVSVVEVSVAAELKSVQFSRQCFLGLWLTGRSSFACGRCGCRGDCSAWCAIAGAISDWEIARHTTGST